MSHGYVQYRIKTNANLPNGVQIPNTAQIYFDFNLPIATNTTINPVNFNSSISKREIKNDIRIWPVPFKDYLMIETSTSGEFVVKNILGQEITHGEIKEDAKMISTLGWVKGVYFIEVTSNRIHCVKKLIKQ